MSDRITIHRACTTCKGLCVVPSPSGNLVPCTDCDGGYAVVQTTVAEIADLLEQQGFVRQEAVR